MRLVWILAALGVCSVLQIPSLYGSTPFFQEPPALNFQVYGGFREDYLKFRIGADRHDEQNKRLGLEKINGQGPESFVEFHRRCKENDPCFVSPCDEDPCGVGCFREEKRKQEEKNLQNFSKVQWKYLKISEIGASINYSTGNHYYMRAKGDYGRIFQGKGIVSNRFTILQAPELPCHQPPHKHPAQHKNAHAIESNGLPSFPLVQEVALESHKHHKHHEHPHKLEPIHYQRLNEISKQSADADHGNVCDLSGGLGWKVISGGGRGWIAGIIGYSYEHQDLEMKNFKVEEDTYNIIAPEALEGLKASYETRWAGPWVGIDFSAKVECDVTVFGTAEWHYADYRGKGSWRQSNNFCANIRQHAKGYGFVGALGFDWVPSDQWGIGLLFNYQQWSTRKGGNHSHVENQQPGSQELVSTLPVAKKSTFYGVKWVTFGVALQASYRY